MQTIAEDFVLFCSIDSKAKSWKNGDLRQQKKLTGLPSLAFLDAEGAVLIKINGRATGRRQFEATGQRFAFRTVRATPI